MHSAQDWSRQATTTSRSALHCSVVVSDVVEIVVGDDVGEDVGTEVGCEVGLEVEEGMHNLHPRRVTEPSDDQEKSLSPTVIPFNVAPEELSQPL